MSGIKEEEEETSSSSKQKNNDGRRVVKDEDDTDEEDLEDVPQSASSLTTTQKKKKNKKEDDDDRVPRRPKPTKSSSAADETHHLPNSAARTRKRRSGWSFSPEDAAPDTTEPPPPAPDVIAKAPENETPHLRKGSLGADSNASQTKIKTSGFSAPSVDTKGAESTSVFTSIVAGEAALQSSRLHLLVQQMGLTEDQTKAARELYVGNLPPQMEVSHLVDFLNAALLAMKGNVLPGPPVVRGWRASEGVFAFAEFRTMEEANNGIQLNGINCLGYSLRIGRPKTYPEILAGVPAAQQGTLPPTSTVTNGIITGVSLGTVVNKDLLGSAFNEAISRLSGGGTIATSVGAVTPPPDAMCMRNLPPPEVFSQDRAREMLTAFGSLKFFLYYGFPSDSIVKQKLKEYKNKRHLADEKGMFVPRNDSRKKGQENSGGSNSVAATAVKLCNYFIDDLLSYPAERSVCFFEYHNPLDSQNLTDEIDQMKIAGLRPTLCAAEIPLAEEELTRLVVNRIMSQRCEQALVRNARPLLVPTRCLFFDNVATVEELLDDTEYSDILDDVRVECRKYGRVISIELPKPNSNQPDTNTHVFVEFSTVEEACRTRKALNGRRFSGRRVRADFLSEVRYSKRDFTQPECNTDLQHSTLYNTELAHHVPQLLKQMEEMERAGREAARAAATAAANASFTGGVVEMQALPTMQALIDVPKPSFDEDVDRDEEAMEEDDE